MKRNYIITAIIAMLCCLCSTAQTLNVVMGDVTYQYPASQAGDMTYTDNGSSLTIAGKTFSTGLISKIYTDGTSVSDNTVSVSYEGTQATVAIAGNIAQYIETATVSGAHVTIEQTEELTNDLIKAGTVDEISYSLSGSSSDGSFTMDGKSKATIELRGLTLTNPSGAAINILDGKRIALSAKNGTENTLADGSGSQKACLYCKGHLELKGKGTLNVSGNYAHAIKSGDYMEVKNLTLNVLGAVKDGLSCNEYFLMESGTVSISGVGDDGIQCDIDNDEGTSTGETTDHEDEDSGNIYLEGGTLTISVTADAAKGVKADGDMRITGGDINVTTSGGGTWDTDDSKTKASTGLSSDGNMTITDGTLTLTSTGGGGKGISTDGTLTISGGTINITTTGGIVAYANGTLSNNYTGNTDRLDSDYKSSPKGIKADGNLIIDGGTINVNSSKSEGIESKGTITINGGQTFSQAGDDAINASGDMTINGGYVCAYSTGNDGLDANGNCYIKGGVVYAIGTTQPEVAIDANTEGGKKLYIQGGSIITCGSLESGAQLSQSCYQASSWNKNAWYALYNGDELVIAIRTPSAGGNGMVVSTSGTPTLKSDVTVSDGTAYFGGMANVGGTISCGNTVSLSSYTGNSGGPGGGGFPGRR